MKMKYAGLAMAINILWSCLGWCEGLDLERGRTWACIGYPSVCRQMKAEGRSQGMLQSLLEAKAILYSRRSDVFQDLRRAEHEFRSIARDVLIKYELATKNKSGSAIPVPDIAFGAGAEIELLALPTKTILVGFGRSAINFHDEKLILFDFEYWKQASAGEKILIAMTEYMRFAGIENEEDRYQAASEIVDAVAKQDFEFVDFTMTASSGAFEVFDRNKIFIAGITQDRSSYALIHSRSPSINHMSCRGDDKLDPRIRNSFSFRTFRPMPEVQPVAVEACQRWMLERRNDSINFLMSPTNHMVVNCSSR